MRDRCDADGLGGGGRRAHDSRAELPPDPVGREPHEPRNEGERPPRSRGEQAPRREAGADEHESGRKLDGRGACGAPGIRREIAVAARDPDGQ